MADLKIGFIGLDTSHVVAFSQILNDTKHAHHVPGGRVVAAYSKVSPDFELSFKRADGFTKQLKEKYDIQIMQTPEALAAAVDMVFIMSVDGRVHLDQFRKVVGFRKPTYIDKPFTVSLNDAEEIFRLAGEANIPVMSSSSLRYARPLVDAVAAGVADIVGVDAFGPMAEQATQPGLFWYGIHTVEMVMAAMGPGCREVRAFRNEGADQVTMIWKDGRTASMRGLRNGHSKFGMTIHRKKGFEQLDMAKGEPPMYAGLIAAIMRSLPKGTSDIPPAQTLEVIAIIEAANKSRETGKAVEL